MDKEQKATTSSESSEVEAISNNIEEIKEDQLNTTNSENDYRIKCTNNESLRKIMSITLNHVEELADSCNLGDSRNDFVSVFRESFKNALQENILVNGLPLILDENKNLSAPEKEDHLNMVDDVLFSKLSKEVAKVAQKRKFTPENCKKIFKMEKTHKIQHMKRVKVVDSSLPSTSLQLSVQSSSKDDSNLKKFSEFCKGFETMHETIQCKLQKREQLNVKLNAINEINKKQKLCPKTTKNDKDVALQ